VATELQGVRVLVPVTITSAMLKTGTTLAEPDLPTGEVAWVAANTYAVGDSRTYDGVIYDCVRTVNPARSTIPKEDAQYWTPMGPTARMAPFDDYGTTTAKATGTLRYVIQPGGLITGSQAYNLQGDTYQYDIYDDLGGTLLKRKTGSLYAQAAGLWELLFEPLPKVNRITIEDFPMAPKAVVDVRVTSLSALVPAKIGDIKVGSWRFLAVDAKWGRPEYGASMERKSNAYRKDNKDGTYSLVRRPSYREVSFTAILPPEQAMYADAVLEEITDVAVPVEVVNLPQYDYLNTIGFVSGTVKADNYGETVLDLKVRGNI